MNFQWLTRDDLAAPILNNYGSSYTKRDFERIRAIDRAALYPQTALKMMHYQLVDACWRIAKLIVAASEKDDYYPYLYRIDRALEVLEEDFNKDAKSAYAKRVKLGEKSDDGITTYPDFAIIEKTMLAELKKLKAAKMAIKPRSKK